MAILLCSAAADAQTVLDVAKITCDQYVHAKVATPNYIAAWLSGYYHAKRNDLTIDVQRVQENVNALEKYCYQENNFKVPLMQAIEKVVGGKN